MTEEDGRKPLPPELEQALGEQEPLRHALAHSGMSRGFQAMVIGLATLRRVNPDRRPKV